MQVPIRLAATRAAASAATCTTRAAATASAPLLGADGAGGGWRIGRRCFARGWLCSGTVHCPGEGASCVGALRGDGCGDLCCPPFSTAAAAESP